MNKIQTVLVADDSLTERVHLTKILEDAGYTVVGAASGNEAVAMAEQHQPDLIFMDIIMEDGDGYKACRTIRRKDALKDVPVIMVSSKSNSVDKKWAEKLGATAYIVKPYADSEIVQAIKTIDV